MNKADEAKALFCSGANCAQAVFGAFAGECGMDQADAFRLASGMGAGMGRMREVCGAVSAMILVANCKFGNSDITDKAAKDAHYTLIQRLAEKFKAETGSIVCRELLGLTGNQNAQPVSEARSTEYYKKRPCTEMVALAAKITEELLADGIAWKNQLETT